MRSGRSAFVVDAALVAVALLDAVVSVDTDHPFTAFSVVVAALALAVRRRRPFLVFAVCLPAAAVSLLAPAAPIALYTVATKTHDRRVLTACGLLYTLFSAAPRPGDDLSTLGRTGYLVGLGFGLATAGAMIFLGQLVQARRDLEQRLAEIDAAREHERELVAETVLAKERAQLAREMHDVVSHQVSLIAVQAGALQVNTSDPDTRQAARTIRELSVRTLDELRHMVNVLRASGVATTELTPQPTLAGLEQLIANSGIETRVIGTAPAGSSAPVQRAIYRTVQEALTNIRKHAPGAAATIRIRHHRDTLEVTVTNTPATHPCLPLPGAHHGLIGLRERAELLGGGITAGPTADDGYEVRLRLPDQPRNPQRVPDP